MKLVVGGPVYVSLPSAEKLFNSFLTNYGVLTLFKTEIEAWTKFLALNQY